MKHNILVFPCGSEIGLEIHNSLGLSMHFNLLGGSSADDHGKFVFKNYIGGIPPVNAHGFTDKINEIVKTHKIDFIFPAHDSVILKLAQEKAQGNLDCGLITSPVLTCEIARSKQKTYTVLKDIIPTPHLYNLEDVNDSVMPVFLKPDVGQGSKGTYLAKSLEDINFYTKKDPSLLILEYLPGIEYTIDCFTNKDGQLLFCEGRERKRILNGISANTYNVDDSRFMDLARKINDHLEFRGAWFFQLKENEQGDLVLVEIAPRIAGTSGLARSKGVNLSLLSLFDAMGVEVSVFENDYQIVMDRALQNRYQHNIHYEHVYLDFDDLVVLEDKVNPRVMAFVYQCLNNRIKMHLITRHKDDLGNTLTQYRLKDIFDDLIWLKEGEEKYNYITEKKAIFIDDSFAERKKVHDKLGIPVFDAHMLEGLME